MGDVEEVHDGPKVEELFWHFPDGVRIPPSQKRKREEEDGREDETWLLYVKLEKRKAFVGLRVNGELSEIPFKQFLKENKRGKLNLLVNQYAAMEEKPGKEFYNLLKDKRTSCDFRNINPVRKAWEEEILNGFTESYGFADYLKPSLDAAILKGNWISNDVNGTYSLQPRMFSHAARAFIEGTYRHLCNAASDRILEPVLSKLDKNLKLLGNNHTISAVCSDCNANLIIKSGKGFNYKHGITGPGGAHKKSDIMVDANWCYVFYEDVNYQVVDVIQVNKKNIKREMLVARNRLSSRDHVLSQYTIPNFYSERHNKHYQNSKISS